MFVRMIVIVPASVPVHSNDAYIFQVQKISIKWQHENLIVTTETYTNLRHNSVDRQLDRRTKLIWIRNHCSYEVAKIRLENKNSALNRIWTHNTCAVPVQCSTDLSYQVSRRPLFKGVSVNYWKGIFLTFSWRSYLCSERAGKFCIRK